MRLLLLALLLSLAGCAESHPRDYALRIITGKMVCSATAVGPDTIETAAHCLSKPLTSINGKPAKVERSQEIAFDRLRVVVSGVTFKTWAKLGEAVQGQRVRWWGQPRGFPFIAREGRVAGVFQDGVLIDGTVCPGDSGSGLFNDAGELVGVVSAMSDPFGCTFVIGR